MLGGNRPQHTEASLPNLPPHLQSDTHLTAHLASRFHVSLPTAKLSSQALICLNTYTSSTRGPNGGKEGSAMAEAEDLARRAWTRLGNRGEDQAVVFLYVHILQIEHCTNLILVVNPGLVKPPFDRISFPRFYPSLRLHYLKSFRSLPLFLIRSRRRSHIQHKQPLKLACSTSCNTMDPQTAPC